MLGTLSLDPCAVQSVTHSEQAATLRQAVAGTTQLGGLVQGAPWCKLSLPPAGLQRLRGGASALSPSGGGHAGKDALEQVTVSDVS